MCSLCFSSSIVFYRQNRRHKPKWHVRLCMECIQRITGKEFVVRHPFKQVVGWK